MCSPRAQLFEGEGPVLVATVARDAARQAALRAIGAEVIELPADKARSTSAALMKELARRAINEVHVEAGFASMAHSYVPGLSTNYWSTWRRC